MASQSTPKVADLSEDAFFFGLLTRSYARLVGSPLVTDDSDATWLYRHAPFAVVAHNTERDPRFIYANLAAQACFEYPWDEFVQLRSRLSAELPERLGRQRMLQMVALNGFVADYRGVRMAKSGRRFWLEDGVVWQLMNENGVSWGQAAVFRSWRDA